MHVLVHGGAGTEPVEPNRRQAVLDDAVTSGAEQSDPQAAACTAVRRLEADPRFNAGLGSAVQSDGRIRTDAGLMTSDGETGAACGMPGVEHASAVARLVKTETPHVLLAGERALALAAAHGVDTDCDLWTTATRERWDDADPPEGGVTEQLSWVREHFGTGHDTVGAVATDGESLAAATSTGGRWFALAGRVGDVPQVGAGFYATASAAVSATGDGEAIARFGLARAVAEAVGDGESPQHAADRVLRGFATATDREAGVIVASGDGTTGQAHNTAAMQTAASESPER
jgi:isoaspartyl peptidase/L-asparaginase-like protein (Ntn-hydrolase superfamily)